jgi:hypothetical protein
LDRDVTQVELEDRHWVPPRKPDGRPRSAAIIFGRRPGVKGFSRDGRPVGPERQIPPGGPACGRRRALVFGAPAWAARPDFGPNVKIFDPSMSTSQIQSVVDSVYAQQVDSELRDQALRPPLQAGDVRRDRADGFGR